MNYDPIVADSCQLAHRVRPMYGQYTDRTIQTITTGYTFV